MMQTTAASSRSRSTVSGIRSGRRSRRSTSTRLAAYVDEKMRAAAESTPSGDSLRLAVLAALNIADELFRCRDASERATASSPNAPSELERLLDRVLMARTPVR